MTALKRIAVDDAFDDIYCSQAPEDDQAPDDARHDKQPRGSRQGSAKLTEAEAAAIYLDRGKQRDIAAAYGVSQGTVAHIKGHRSWRHVSTRIADEEGV